MVIDEQQLIAKVHYPQDAIPVWASDHAPAGNQLVVSLPGAPNRFTYLAKAIITTQAPPAKQNMEVIVTDGTITGYIEMVQTEPAGAFAHIDLADTPIMASTMNTPITVTIPAVGGGAVPGLLLVGYQR